METNVGEGEPHARSRIRPNICIDSLAASTVLGQSSTESAQEKERAETCSPPETGMCFVIICMPAMLSKAHTDFHMSLCLSVRESVHIET